MTTPEVTSTTTKKLPKEPTKDLLKEPQKETTKDLTKEFPKEKVAKEKGKMDVETKLSLLMKSLNEFYKEPKYVEEIKSIIDQNSVISLRILDWFVTNFSRKHRTYIDSQDVYQSYKLQLKAFSKKSFDPFSRKNKIIFYYTDNDYIETSCGQLCFFRWCFQSGILDYVKNHLQTIEQDMKNSLKSRKVGKSTSAKRQPLSISASRSVSRQNVRYTVKFD